MKYISKYSNDKHITPAQYITEIICENKAKQEKKDLHFKFWTNKEWASYYRNQIATANKLVAKYPPNAIIQALKSKKAEKIFSLRAPHLISIIEQEAKALESLNKSLSQEFDRSENKKFTKETNKKNTLSRLKELE